MGLFRSKRQSNYDHAAIQKQLAALRHPGHKDGAMCNGARELGKVVDKNSKLYKDALKRCAKAGK